MAQSSIASTMEHSIGMSRDSASPSLPPEMISAVFGLLPLKDLLPMRHVSTEWNELVDMEARLRLLRITNNVSCPLVMQAGPPATYDFSQSLLLSFTSFTTRPPGCDAALTATLSVAYDACALASDRTSMGADGAAVFQNIIVSVTRRHLAAHTARNTQLGTHTRDEVVAAWRRAAFGPSSLGDVELARETDRIWREWWDGAPSSPSSSASHDTNDSGFQDTTIDHEELHEKLSMSPCAVAEGGMQSGAEGQKSCCQTLTIGGTIQSATMDLTTTIAERSARALEYRWLTLDIDVFRLLLIFEDKYMRSGMSAMLNIL